MSKKEKEGGFGEAPIKKNRTSTDLNVSPPKPGMKEATTPTPQTQESGEGEETETIELKYPTHHLRGFDQLRKSTRLHGKEYTLIVKALWYSLLSLKNEEVGLKVNDLVTDGRIHLLIPLPSGKGKKELKRVIKEVMAGIGKTVEEPTSLHPEQLVGKTIRRNKRGKTEYESIEGYFSRDYVIIDEGRTLLTSSDLLYTESRRYLRLALDPYPHNKITKKPVDIPFGEELEYTPYMGCCIFTQPYSFEEEFALDGDLRRFLVPYTPMTGIDRTEAYKSRVIEVNEDEDKSIQRFAEFIESLPEYREYKTSSEAKIELVDDHLILLRRGLRYSSKVRNFSDLYDFTLQDLLLKMSHIQALQERTNTIGKDHVARAFIDLLEFTERIFEFVENKVMGALDYGEIWNGATDKDQDLLRFLYDEGCLSPDQSNVSISDYENKIREVFLVGERQSIRIKRKHKKNGWISSKKGQYDSKVWLDFEPKVRPVRPDMTSPGIQKVYEEKIKKYIPDDMSPLTPLKDDSPDDIDPKLRPVRPDMTSPGIEKEFSEKIKKNIPDDMSPVTPLKEEGINYEGLTNEDLNNKARHEDDHEAQAELERRILAEDSGTDQGTIEASDQSEEEKEKDYTTIPLHELNEMVTFTNDRKAYDEYQRRVREGDG